MYPPRIVLPSSIYRPHIVSVLFPYCFRFRKLSLIHILGLDAKTWEAEDIPMVHLTDARRYVCDPDEILSTDVAAMGVDRIDWDGTQYHA